MPHDLSIPDDFSGRVRLFPLPRLVMFPHVMQPLHIFEPRYREMFQAALADDRLIAMAVLAPGWEDDYDGCPALFPMLCLGRVATWQQTDDGRYNLLLLGLRRARLVRELPAEKSYREAVVELEEDVYPEMTAQARPALRRSLTDQLKKLVRKLPNASEPLDELLGSQVPLGTLCDIFAYTLDLHWQFKERLLREMDVDRRAAQLLAHLVAAPQADPPDTPRHRPYPPPFGQN